MELYQVLATQNANWPGKGTALGLIYVAGKLAGETGELVQQPFKAMRDDDLLFVQDHDAEIQFLAVAYQDLTPERRAKIIKEAGGVLWYLAALATELGMNLSDIALANLEQLADRTERGTLSGDGDDR
ncbi:hypothetical protein HUU40_00300 [candidate division KSB1 bacterium]|nr:hypothetical protein [candidate division KSB1 bacterium]